MLPRGRGEGNRVLQLTERGCPWGWWSPRWLHLVWAVMLRVAKYLDSRGPMKPMMSVQRQLITRNFRKGLVGACS